MTYDATGSAGAGNGSSDQSTTEQAKERAAEMAGTAQEKVMGVVEGQVDQRSDEAADKVESVADDVRAVSESLSDRGQDAAARVVEQGADYAQQLSDYLRGSSSQQILDDVASFARRQPWAVAAGGLLIGFAASRVLRASAQNETSSQQAASATYAAQPVQPSAGTYGAGAGTYGTETYANDPYATGTGTGTATFDQPVAYSTETGTSADPNQLPAPVTSSVDGR